MEVISSTTPAVSAGEELSNRLERFSDRPILLLLSGGSALHILDHISQTVLGPNLTISTLDERFSTEPTVNNFTQIQQSAFYGRAVEHGVSAIDTSIAPADTLRGAGERFEKALQNWHAKHPDGVMLATMGVGADGHTAGIFPGSHTVDFSGEEWVVAYEVPESANPHQQRITVTYTFLQTQVAEVLVYVTGSDKQSVIQDMQSSSCTLETMPACIIPTLNQVTLVTDFHEE
jgi:6-phosphogluconolactonase/glucosamine-6-phosphate isomerase/deaminase